jgi:hypothetical protein
MSLLPAKSALSLPHEAFSDPIEALSLPHEAFSDPHEALSLPHEAFSDPHEALSLPHEALSLFREVFAYPALPRRRVRPRFRTSSRDRTVYEIEGGVVRVSA